MESARSVDAVDPVGELAERDPSTRAAECSSCASLEIRADATEDVLTRLRQILPPVTEGKQMANWQPIDQDWIKRYVDQLREVASKWPVSSSMHAALVMRADHVMDLVKAWRERKDPRMPLPDPPVTEG